MLLGLGGLSKGGKNVFSRQSSYKMSKVNQAHRPAPAYGCLQPDVEFDHAHRDWHEVVELDKGGLTRSSVLSSTG